MNEDSQTPSGQKSTRNSGKNSVPGIILRLILVLVTGIMIGLVIFFSFAGTIPYLDQRVFDPLKNNQSDINNLKATQQSLANQLANLQNINTIQQSTLETMNTDLLLNTDFMSLRETVENSAELVSEQILQIATLDARIESNNDNLSALATAQIKRSDLQQDLSLLKIIDLLLLTNQYLAHANFGQAEDQLDQVKVELESLFSKSPAFQQTFISNLLKLVNETIEDLPENFSLAENKINLAIAMALQGFPEQTQYLSLTATPDLTPTNPSNP